MSCAKVGCQKNAIKLHHVAKAPQEKKRKWEKLQSSRIKDGRHLYKTKFILKIN